jgi:predicted DNA binding CopG/RHH family protein
MKAKLDRSERAIEAAAAAYRAVTEQQRKRIETIIGRCRKSRNINIRVSEATLAELKRRSEQEGLPYQTLISSILHKYLTNRLVDEEAVTKSLQLLRSER